MFDVKLLWGREVEGGGGGRLLLLVLGEVFLGKIIFIFS